MGKKNIWIFLQALPSEIWCKGFELTETYFAVISSVVCGLLNETPMFQISCTKRYIK